MVLVVSKMGELFEQIGAGFGVSATTCWRGCVRSWRWWRPGHPALLQRCGGRGVAGRS